MSKRKKKKSESEQAVDTAREAGAHYAQDQLSGDFFRDWVWDQLFEAEEMRKRDPNSVIPLESPDDYHHLAHNMLQQLGWDIDRGLDHREAVALAGDDSKEVVQEFWDGLHDELTNPNVVHNLVDELMLAHEDVVAARREREDPPQRSLPGVRERTAESRDDGSRPISSRKRVRHFSTSTNKKGEKSYFVTYVDGTSRQTSPDDIAQHYASRGHRVPPDVGTAREVRSPSPTVRDYVAVDHRNRVVAGPFKDYGKAKQEADRAGGVVRFVMDRGTARPSAGLREGRTTVTAGKVTTTSTGAEYRGVPGVDVDVMVKLPDGRSIDGAVTLLQAEDGSGRWVAWGDPENWVSGNVLSAIRGYDQAEYRDVLDAIEAEAAAAASRHSVPRLREDPRDFGYDPDIRSGPRNFPRLRRLPPESR